MSSPRLSSGVHSAAAENDAAGELRPPLSQPQPQEQQQSQISPPPSPASRLDTSVSVARQVYSQAAFDSRYDSGRRGARAGGGGGGGGSDNGGGSQSPRKKPSPIARLKDALHRACRCTPERARRLLLRRFPIIDTLRSYNLRRDLPGDLVAGVTVGVTNVQQGMAYGLLATLTPAYGLYVSFYPALIYFFLATSLHNSIGVFAVVSLMVASAVESRMQDFVSATHGAASTTVAATVTDAASHPVNATMTDEELQYRVGIATSVCLLTGLFQVIMGLMRFGFITIYMADPIISGFTAAVAFHVLSSQIPTMLGVKSTQASGILALIHSYTDLFQKIRTASVPEVVISIVSLVVLLSVKIGVNEKFKTKLRIPIPIELILVVIATIASHFGNFKDVYGVEIVGEIPRGLQAPAVPPMNTIVPLLGPSFAIAIVAFAVSVSMAQMFAKKHNYEIDANQEMLAYGVTNSVCSFFGCFPACASVSRSSIQENAGGRTPVTDVVSSLLVLIVLLGLGPYMKALPKSVLSCIVVAGLISVFSQFSALKTLWKVSKYDFAMWVMTFLAVVILNVDSGLAVGMAFGVLATMFRSQRAHTCLLGRISRTDIYRNIAVYKAACEISGVKIFRMDAPLYYVNSELFRHRLYKLTGVNPRELQRERERALAEARERQRREDRARKKAARAAAKQASRRESATAAVSDSARAETGSVEQCNEREPPLLVANDETTATAAVATEATEATVVAAAADVTSVPAVHHVIIDCTPMNYIDSTGVKMLLTVYAEYRQVDIRVLYAGCRGAVRAMLKRTGFYQEVTPDSLYISVHDATLAAAAARDEAERERLQADVIVSDLETDSGSSDGGDDHD